MPVVHGEGCGCRGSDEVLKGAEFLLKYIDRDKITALNEKIIGSCKKVFKAYDDRHSPENCESNADHEMIIHIPFTCPCKIVSMFLIGGENGCYPKKVKIFSNTEDLDFNNIEDAKYIQEIDLAEEYHGSVEYPLKVTFLSNVSHLTLYFCENYGAATTQIYFIGFKGIGTNYKRQAVVTTYEASPNLADHKVDGVLNLAKFNFDGY